MQVNAVCTWSFEPWFERSSWTNTETMLGAFCASIINVNEHLELRPCLYTDSLGAEFASDLNLPTEIIVCLDDLYEKSNVSKKYWMYPKLETYAKQQDPYFHFDLDFIVHRQFPKWFWQADVGFQNYEFFLSSGIVYLDSVNDRLVLPDIFYRYKLDKVNYPNVGCLLINNMEFNKKYSQLAIKMVKDNPLGHEYVTEKQIMDCVVEQQLLGLLLRESKLNYVPFLENSSRIENSFFEHYLANAKNSNRTYQKMSKYFSDKTAKWSRRLDSMKINK